MIFCTQPLFRIFFVHWPLGASRATVGGVAGRISRYDVGCLPHRASILITPEILARRRCQLTLPTLAQWIPLFEFNVMGLWHIVGVVSTPHAHQHPRRQTAVPRDGRALLITCTSSAGSMPREQRWKRAVGRVSVCSEQVNMTGCLAEVLPDSSG